MVSRYCMTSYIINSRLQETWTFGRPTCEQVHWSFHDIVAAFAIIDRPIASLRITTLTARHGRRRSYTTMSSAIRRKLRTSTSQHYIICMLPCRPPPFTSCLSTYTNQATKRRRRRFDVMSGVVRHSDDNDNPRTRWRQQNICTTCCRLVRGHVFQLSSILCGVLGSSD